MNSPDLPEASRPRVAWLHGRVLCACVAASDAPVMVVNVADEFCRVTHDTLVAFVSEAALYGLPCCVRGARFASALAPCDDSINRIHPNW